MVEIVRLDDSAATDVSDMSRSILTADQWVTSWFSSLENQSKLRPDRNVHQTTMRD